MNTPHLVFVEYQHWKGHWDDLCNQCGKCCYTRHLSFTGEVVVDQSSPCENLDEETHLCRVFENRFKECNHCGRVNLARALFYPLMPSDCAYVQTFRVWRKNTDKGENDIDAL